MTKNYLNMRNARFTGSALALLLFSLFSGCNGDDPQKEDTPEMITKVTLTFTPQGGGSAVVVTATDPDGEGVQDIIVDGSIILSANKSYMLDVTLTNALAQPSEPAYDITGEVRQESDEHLFFFGWTNNVFNDPTGDGNIDNRNDDVNYEDADENGLPVGLETFWTTAAKSSGTFRVILKHQPGSKTSSSGSTVGETDLDISFVIQVE